MASIKKEELKSLAVPQLESKLRDLKKEMMKFNTQRATKTTLESPGRVRAVRKTIARIYTFIHQKKQQEQKTKPTVPSKQTPSSQPSQSTRSKKTKQEVRKQ